MNTVFIVISNILILIAYIIYGWSIIVGRTRPHRTTRFVLLLITALALASLFEQGSGVAFWLIGACALGCFVIFLFSLWYGMGGWAKVDILCLLVAVLGIVLWQVTGNPVVALFFAIAADFSGMIPAFIKTYRLPHTEYWMSYVFDVLAGIFTLLAITNWTAGEYSYPLYIVLINIVMLGLILRKQIFSLGIQN